MHETGDVRPDRVLYSRYSSFEFPTGEKFRISFIPDADEKIFINRSILVNEFGDSTFISPNEDDIRQYNATQVILEIIPKMKPTHVYANTGWSEKDISCFLVGLRYPFKTAYITGIYRFAALNQNNEYSFPPQNPLPTTVLACKNVSVFDRYEITKNVEKSMLYSDDFHVLSTVNEEMNHLLLFDICPEMQRDGI